MCTHVYIILIVGLPVFDDMENFGVSRHSLVIDSQINPILYNTLAYSKPQITLLTLLKWIPQPQIDGIRYIKRVSGSFSSNVMVLVFSVAAILELCKLGAFHPWASRGGGTF